ncbi:hypothetical protein GRJ2_003044800 [Grus japonensis]|uniref:Uncharacterized protein n=1 Tax=Grus japonensis TaxID=30415 RepID=A0ABC9Y9W4_GRUJA
MPSSYEGVEPISISGVTGGSQQLTLLEAEVSLTANEWQKHRIVTGPEAPCILGIDYLWKGYFKDPKGYQWAFGIAALEVEEIEPLSSLPGLSEDPSVVGLLRVEEQQVLIATTTVHRRQYRTNRDSLVPIHKLIRQLEGQGVISRTHSPFNSPIWPVWKSNGEWRLTVDYRGLNEATPYNKLTEDEKPYALFTDGSCHIVGKHRRWKAAVWSPTRRVAEAAEGQGESSQFAEVKAIQLVLDIAEKVANTVPLYRLMDGGQCPVGVVTAVEAEQLATQRQTHLGCPILARYCCPAREAGCKGEYYAINNHMSEKTNLFTTKPIVGAYIENWYMEGSGS